MLNVLEYAAIMYVYFFFTSHAYDVVRVLVTVVSSSVRVSAASCCSVVLCLHMLRATRKQHVVQALVMSPDIQICKRLGY
jgi:hypothetical protein